MRSIVLAAALTIPIVGAGSAQQPTFKRTELQRADLSVPNKEAVTASVDIPAGVQSGRHTHPGEEVGYVIEGTLLLELDGKPARTLKAGEAFLIPSGQIHNARNTGPGQARVLATYIIDKGKPMATPVP